jgi:hypothetical protein
MPLIPFRLRLATGALLGALSLNSHATSLEPAYPGTGLPDPSMRGYITQPAGGSYTRLTPVIGAGQMPDPSRPSYLLRDSSDDSLQRLRDHLHEDDAIDEMRRLDRRRRLEADE